MAMSPVEYWNKVAGPAWVTNQEVLDTALAPFGEALVDHARLGPGERVVDVGCGCGVTTLEAARRCGRAQGLDISRPMLAHARKRALEARLAAEFIEGDAATYGPAEAPLDKIISRFGLMFFQSPRCAFANMRSWLRPGGQLVAICWQPPVMNPWLAMPVEVARRHIPARDFDLESWAPFSLGDRDHLCESLREAGFTSVDVVEVCHPMRISGTLEDAHDFFIERGPVVEVLLAADAPTRDAAMRALGEVLASRYDGSAVELDAAAWLVRATR
ncbi:MAG: methyltransferase domain-containing protein [Byssovorax sp.]